MNLIIVTTDWKKEIWKKLKNDLLGNNRVKRYIYGRGNNDIHYRFIDVSNQAGINLDDIHRIDLQLDDNYLVLIKQGEINNNTEMVKNVITAKFSVSGDCNIYLAMHKNGGLVNINEIKNKKPAKCQLSHCEFIHEPSDEVYKGLVCFVLKFFGKDQNIWKKLGFDADFNFCQNDYKSAFNNLIEIIKKKSVISKLSHLIHCIAYIFLPLDIDLMGIKEVKEGQTNENKAIKYLKEVLQEKDDKYYRQKLAVLQYIVAGKHIDFSQAKDEIKECSPVKPPDTQKLLPDDKSIYDLILESDKEDVIGSKEWQELKFLCGLEKKDNNADKKNPTNKKIIYKPINYEDSPILQFMCLLDSKIEKCRNNGCSIEDVEEILNYFKTQNWEIKVEQENKGKGEQKNKKKDEQENKKKINSFHDWFCALMNCLEKLREKIE